MKSSLQRELGKSTPFDLLEQEAYLNLARTHAEVTAPFHALFRSVGLSDATYNVLRILRGSGRSGRRCSEIVADMVVRVPDVTRLVDRLIEGGLVERERSETDRRVVIVRITKKGRDVLVGLDARVIELHRQTLGHMTQSELTTLNRLLVKARTPDEGEPTE